MSKRNSWSFDALLEAYEQHQQRTRGLRSRTLQGYQYATRQFLRAVGQDPVDLSRLAPSDVVAFFVSVQGRYRSSTMRTLGTSLRSFFRYLREEGLCDAPLAAAIPAVPQWKLAHLPRGLSEEQYERLIASLRVGTLCGYRDRAMILSLATMGLRPGEVANLRLEDVDWRGGALHLQTRKSRCGASLPLPHLAGRAIAEYLREERPPSPERNLFLRHSGRRRGEAISAGIVTGAVVRALRRAEIEAPISGAYVLRHTLAIRMVRQGTKLKEVADVLGHKDLSTTTIYAKVDLTTLREVALPCPEGTP